ncbi:MAG TPA: 50S ribosomal protein L25/general stress protein Ctc [Woeseiaceae bacterium]|nr:50S ribosomal protein L25/general stress protein Ctc [Woeseiaceae bacterium]
MKAEFDLVAELRDDQGKGASRRLRRQGKIPAILYGGGRPPRALLLDHNKVLQHLDHEAFYSSILTIKVGDKTQAAILKDVQRHPAKRHVLHMDMQRIVEDEKIRMNVPIHFVGEQSAPGVKLAGGSVSRMITDVEISCLPRDLPEYLEVDISNLELDDMLYLSDIKLPEGVDIIELQHGEEHDQAIVSVHVMRTSEVEEEVEVAAAPEVPVVGADESGEDKDDKTDND